ncbi:proprotein convertase P-domain-containing protein [Flavobacteriaceae bacterium XHP0103]|uniref:proprotein convertase P-domain-containing protein n=1 Tax=Marixanthotalea marina TaxID=2844359 RepID=UPI002989C291|nr:proprotein convertase P-domain-containing protein [Marixanthotalea marina]MBU3822841.1 proprotein convertase P-domain-containing protein [Marixanthotalea marina]
MKSLKIFSLLRLYLFFLISINFYGQDICTDYSVNPGTNISWWSGTYNTTITVPDSYVLTDVNVTVNISHTWNEDLDIYLISPTGTTVELSTDNGGNGDNYNNVTFDDASTNTLPTGNTTLSGTYRPEGSLASFNGQNSNGDWTLRVTDDTNWDGGTINSITLNLCYTATISGYTGPGGVGSNDGTSGLIMWYRPDNGITTTGTSVDSWINSAGVPAFDMSETGTQRPTLTPTAINGYEEISFNGSNRLRTGQTLTSSNFITNQASSFIIARADNTSQQSSVYTTAPLVTSTRFSSHIPWNGTVYYDIGTCCGTDARIQVGGLSGLNAYSIWEFDAHPTTGKQLYRNLNLLDSQANTSTYNSHSTQRFNIGGNTSGTNGFVGDVAELIVFKTKVNTAQQIIINNYLAAKYGLTLAANDIYTRDNPGAAGNFDHNVAGIGQASDGSNHTDSQGTGIVRISNPTDLDNGEFLFWGEETSNPTYNFTTNTANYTEQLNSKWRVSQPGNNIGDISISFDISSMDLSEKQDCAPLQLVIDNSPDLSSPDDVYDLTIVGNTATATGVRIRNNRYFTLRYTDQIVWDGSNYYNGSGTGNAPNTSDVCFKLTVKAGSAANLITNAHVREVEVEPGATLNVANGVLLEVENQAVVNGSINLLGEAQLIQNHTGASLNSGTGSLTARQQGTTNAFSYNYWSAPVSRGGFWQIGYLEDANGTVNFTTSLNPNPATSPITLSSRWLYKFKGASNDYNAWIKLSPTSNLSPGEGFTMKGSGAATPDQELIFRGIPNDGTYSISVTAGTDFLTGNPYPSTLDANQFINDNLSVIDGTLYFWESFTNNNSHYLSDYEGGYAVYNLMMPLPAVADASGLTSGNGTPSKSAPTQYINVSQGFFTIITNSGTLTFNNAQRAFARESLGETIYYKTNNTKDIVDERPKIWFSFMSPKGQTKMIGLGYDSENATYGYDRAYDAESYDNLKNDIGWILDDKHLAIQALPEINTEDNLPLEIKATDSGIYRFSIDKMEHVPDNLNIYLFNNNTNTYYNLRDSEVELSLNTGDFNEFSIVFSEQISLGSPDFENEHIFTSYNPETKLLTLHVKDIQSMKRLDIFNSLGQSILNINAPETNVVDLSNISNGVYILKVETTVSQKLKNIKFVKY